MNNIVKVLENMGKTPFVGDMHQQEMAAILNPLNVDEDIQSAIFDKDTARLEMLLGVRNKIVCMVNQPEPADSPLEEPTPDNDEPDKTPQPEKVSVSG